MAGAGACADCLGADPVSLIETEGPAPHDADGSRDAVAAATATLQVGDRYEAARLLDRLPDEVRKLGGDLGGAQGRHRRLCRHLRRWAHALLTEATPISEFGQLQMPMHYVTGGRSTESAHGVARRLAKALPNLTLVDLAGLGTWGPSPIPMSSIRPSKTSC
jgi:hypothetical protein